MACPPAWEKPQERVGGYYGAINDQAAILMPLRLCGKTLNTLQKMSRALENIFHEEELSSSSFDTIHSVSCFSLSIIYSP